MAVSSAPSRIVQIASRTDRYCDHHPIQASQPNPYMIIFRIQIFFPHAFWLSFSLFENEPNPAGTGFKILRTGNAFCKAYSPTWCQRSELLLLSSWQEEGIHQCIEINLFFHGHSAFAKAGFKFYRLLRTKTWRLLLFCFSLRTAN